MTWITENPFWLCTTGILLGVFFFVLFVHTQNRRFLLLTIAAGIFTIGSFTVEQLIVTDREAINSLIYKLARNVKENDVQAILDSLAPENTEVRGQVNQLMPACEFRICRVTQRPTVMYIRKSDAEIQFPVFAQVHQSPYGAGTSKVDVKLQLEKREGRWLIKDYGYRLPGEEEYHY